MLQFLVMTDCMKKAAQQNGLLSSKKSLKFLLQITPGVKQFVAGGGMALIGLTLVPLLKGLFG